MVTKYQVRVKKIVKIRLLIGLFVIGTVLAFVGQWLNSFEGYEVKNTFYFSTTVLNSPLGTRRHDIYIRNPDGEIVPLNSFQPLSKNQEVCVSVVNGGRNGKTIKYSVVKSNHCT
ncbi:hypothetical protein [Paraglaciecola sp. L3A3]|uniref:hypothetical protein n=1 Tax=Paraglaciecola sp. L3A3 TaxID=2686358 RepID=UPI00131AD34B|nr:hypothetical protein [Paraglaciecola sp. L3A3]